MELIIKIDDDIAKGIRGENDCKVEPREIVRSFQATIADAIVNGIPYDKVIDEVTELLENEWGYEGMRDDVSRIMKGGAE